MSRARPKAYFATAHVPMDAKSATKMADGMVERLPSLLAPTKSEPQPAGPATALHIAGIASDAQTPVRRSREAQPCSCAAPAGGDEMAVHHLGGARHWSSREVRACSEATERIARVLAVPVR